jgi:hypothetical protein
LNDYHESTLLSINVSGCICNVRIQETHLRAATPIWAHSSLMISCKIAHLTIGVAANTFSGPI